MASALMLLAASCKEHVAPINTDDGTPAAETTYVEAVAAPQNKRILIEELSGVFCTNCPEGAEKLEDMAAQNPDLFSLVTIHTGDFTAPIPNESAQDFRTEDGDAIRTVIYGNEQGSKPTAAFDRLAIGNSGNKYFVNGYNSWPAALQQAKSMHPGTPVNIDVKSVFNDEKNQYDIEVTLKYTEDVTEKQALHIFLTESGIVDAQELSGNVVKHDYVFNHTFRKALTPASSGKVILPDLDKKEAGRVYIYRTFAKIEPPARQQWVPANMKVVVFVSAAAANDKRVVHVQETHLQE